MLMEATISGACGQCVVPPVELESRFEVGSVIHLHLEKEDGTVHDWETRMKQLNVMQENAQQVSKVTC